MSSLGIDCWKEFYKQLFFFMFTSFCAFFWKLLDCECTKVYHIDFHTENIYKLVGNSFRLSHFPVCSAEIVYFWIE